MITKRPSAKKSMFSSIRSFCYQKGEFESLSSDLIVEAPLEIIINGSTYSFVMFTPGMTRELVTGFLFTEGLIEGIDEIETCNIDAVGKGDGEQVFEARVSLPSGTQKLLGVKGRRVSYSSCGICGKENFYELKEGTKRVRSRQKFSMDVLKRLPEKLMNYQPLYKKTGGAHAALLLDPEGEAIVSSEDMGRHNALDKVIGASLLKGGAFNDKILLSSGRASLEMILKTARTGVPLFVAISRPTSRAVEAAKFYNITLIDMAKQSNRIYSHARRIEGF